jgi:hypothetical protein
VSESTIVSVSTNHGTVWKVHLLTGFDPVWKVHFLTASSTVSSTPPSSSPSIHRQQVPRTPSRNAEGNAQYTTWSILAEPSRRSLMQPEPEPGPGQASPLHGTPHSRRTAPCRYQTCQSCRLQARAACHYGRGHSDGSLILHADPKGGARGISIAERGAI